MRDGALLSCLANAADAPQACRDAAQPSGLACRAADAAGLKPCFALVAAELLRGAR